MTSIAGSLSRLPRAGEGAIERARTKRGGRRVLLISGRRKTHSRSDAEQAATVNEKRKQQRGKMDGQQEREDTVEFLASLIVPRRANSLDSNVAIIDVVLQFAKNFCL